MLIVFGANGGIGSAVLEHYSNVEHDYGAVFGATREDCELQCWSSVELFFKNVHNIDGAPDKPWYVLNATGRLWNNLISKIDYDEMQDEVCSTITGSALMLQQFCLRAPAGSKIVLISSVVGTKFGVPGTAVYGACKAAIESLVRTASLELPYKNLGVSCIRMGYFDRGMIEKIPDEVAASIGRRIPIGRWGRVDELVRVLDLHFSCDYMNGSITEISGGVV